MTAKIKNLSFYAIALGLTVLDQVTKGLARIYLPYDKPVKIIPGLFDLHLYNNDGAAFGVAQGFAPLLILITLVAIFAIVKLRSAAGQSKLLSAGLAIILGGAFGNLIDRAFSPSHAVTDFLKVNVLDWPIFNVADIAIVIGAILLIFHVYVLEKRRIGTQ